MIKTPVYIVDLFQAIVNSTSTALDLAVKYGYGPVGEIEETLVSMSKDPVVAAGKFPIVMLITDIDESKGLKFGVESKVSIHLLIATQTEKNLTAKERMEQNFKPTLYPIYAEFINQIARSKFFQESSPEVIQHTKTDRLAWGKYGITGNGKTVFTDLLDCIEIKNLVLNVKTQIC